MRLPAYFTTVPQDVYVVGDFDIDSIITDIESQIERWTGRGSGFIVERLNCFVMCITIYRPLHGSSKIETPDFIKAKGAIVNIGNDDDKCFVWSVLAHVHYVDGDNHPNEVRHYKKFEKTLNLSGLTFPLPVIMPED